MDENTKRELKAYGQLAIGGVQVAGGIATACGHGILSYITRNHHISRAGVEMGRLSIDKGSKNLAEAWRELKG